MASSNSNDGNDEFTRTHSEGSNEEKPTTAYTVNELDTHDCHYGIDYISDDSGKKKKKKFRYKEVLVPKERFTDWMRKALLIPACWKNVCMFDISKDNLV